MTTLKERLEEIADRVHAARFGDGLAGLAAGQGLVVRLLDLPDWFPGAISTDGALVVRETRDPIENERATARLLAHHLLRAVPHGPADIEALAGGILRRDR